MNMKHPWVPEMCNISTKPMVFEGVLNRAWDRIANVEKSMTIHFDGMCVI